MIPLPIDAVIPEIVASLKTHRAVVVEAPPGAGKTTRVPRALLDAGYGNILVLEPRRLATRLSARRVAEELGERVGERVGYQVRFEDVTSPRTRLRFITEGLLRRLVSEAELAAVLSHEMAHQLLGHTREAISAQSGVTRDEPALAYSFEREIQADSLSLKLLKVARYDLRSATSALALGYRESAENVSSVPPDWMAERMANMERKIERIGQFLPATGSTREFNKVRRQLFG